MTRMTNFDYLVNHIIKINSRIQKIAWEEGLLSHVKKYEALRSGLKSPNEQGILDSLRNIYP